MSFPEKLDPQTLKNFTKVSEIAEVRNFYLAGGTALQLHFGHRHSYDLDFFSEGGFDAKNLRDKFSSLSDFEISQLEEDTLLGKVGETKVSFFYYRYKLIGKPRLFLGIRIASLEDIGAMKIDAVSSRGTKRDFFDLYFLSQIYPLEKILGFYDRKYGKLAANKFHLIKSLNYFSDAEEDPDPDLVKKVSWGKVKDFFEKELEVLAVRLLES